MRRFAGKQRDQNEQPDRKQRQTENDIRNQSTHGAPPIAVFIGILSEKTEKIPEKLENFS